MSELQNRLSIPADRLASINSILVDPDERVLKEFLAVVAKYGSPEEINRKHAEFS